VDGAVAVVLFLVDVWVNLFLRGPITSLPWLLLFLAGSAFPLAWRRASPLGVLALVSGIVVAGTALGMPISELGVAVALYTVAARCPRWTAVRCLVVFGAAKAAIDVADGFALSWVPVLLALYTTAVVLGDQQRTNRELAEQEQEALARLAMLAERGRIARELHDVVAHTVSVMVLYTSVARRSLAADPVRADEALAQVEESGRESVTELRRLLCALRSEPADTAPHGSLANLGDLVARCAAAGLPVRLSVDGDRRPLPAGVELCAYRIVQEALTNAAKHATPTEVTVHLVYGETALRIDVRNDGPGRRTGSPGHGLLGMRERAALAGGRLDVRHGETDFRVEAELPYQG
jgi:signal transduction histidine kinase